MRDEKEGWEGRTKGGTRRKDGNEGREGGMGMRDEKGGREGRTKGGTRRRDGSE